MTNNQITGLDMRDTIAWYASINLRLPSPLVHRPLPYKVQDQQFIEISADELSALYSLFPDPARARSITRKIIGKPATWFHRESTGERPIQTNDMREAMSTTSIVPSYTDYTLWKKHHVPAADIHLFQIPKNAASPYTRKIIHAEGFLHEFGHSLTQPAIHIDDYVLRLPDGRCMAGIDAIAHFAGLAEQHPPISHYASTYRPKGNRFESDNPKYNPLTAISEELCESIAAFFLGFVYTSDHARRNDPFQDRPHVRKFVEEFLHAELVSTKSF